nr:hypothetical protein [uncultured Actinotalea sp.]
MTGALSVTGPSATDLSATGLSDAEVAERVAAGLTNRSSVRTSRTVGQIVRANVLTRFNALLGALLVVVLLVGPVEDALFGLVLVANSAVGIVQEIRAKRVLDRATSRS